MFKKLRFYVIANTEWRGPCPIHKGTRDSFAVNPVTGDWFCHSQCARGGSLIDFEMIISGPDFKHAATEVNQIIGRQDGRRSRSCQIKEISDYSDESGNLLFQCLRFEPKSFSQRRPDGLGGWEWNLGGVRRVLYRLPKVQPAKEVFVAESEKDVHTLESLGYVATCNPMGAEKWRDEYSEQLRGKDVILFGDNDEPGRRHIEQMVNSLNGKASSIRVCVVPSGKDVSDWVAAGATHGVIEGAVQSTPALQFGRTHLLGSDKTSATDAAPTLTYTGEPYTASGGCLYGWKQIRENRFPFKIANFVARITADYSMDDGAEQSRVFVITVELAGRTIVTEVPAKEFNAMNWVAEKVGGMAIVLPGQTAHARAAIQTLSGSIPAVHSYSHTGWRVIDGKPYYLHCGGAVGQEGNRSDICVSIEDKLPNYRLPDPPEGEARIAAVRSSLKMLDVALDRTTFPVYSGLSVHSGTCNLFSAHLRIVRRRQEPTSCACPAALWSCDG